MKHSTYTESKNFCPHCGQELMKSTTEGYAFQCVDCDEDFVSFEVISEKRTEITAEDYLEERTTWYEVVEEDLIEPRHARIALAMARSEMKQKAIETFKEICPCWSRFQQDRKCDECAYLKDFCNQLN